MNELYRDLILAKVQAAIGASQAITGVGHKGLKGQLREIVIRDLLRPLFPADIGLGTGEIITSDNQRSKQQDVVVFDKSIVPPILLEETTGIFPIESVLHTVEIKTTLTASEWGNIIESAKLLASLKYLSGDYVSDEMIPHSVPQCFQTVFAFQSDLSGSGITELDRFLEIWGETLTDNPIKIICVIERGCWYQKEGAWYSWSNTYPLEEVIGFIALILNSYKNISLSRGMPRLGHYII